MGWWNAEEDGTSLCLDETGLYWGDGPADIMDVAIEKIVEEFEIFVGRKPTRQELIAGLLFSINVDYPEEEYAQVRIT